MQITVEIDSNGRILVPATFRKTYNWKKGAKLTLVSTKKGLLLTTKEEKINDALNKIRQKTGQMKGVEDFLDFRKQDQN
jgi:bifunctional DNA-binding transcriptional regulator/antitoxin component of YhaV-PrlF toxin-antitoxin module